VSFFAEFKKTLSYCKPQWRFYVIALGALVLVDIADVAAPKFIEMGVEAATTGSTPGHEATWLESLLPAAWFGENAWYHGTWVYGLAFVLVIAFAGYFRFWMSYAISKAAIAVSNDWRNQMYMHVQRLPAKWHDKSTVGDIMSLATNDMDACRFFWGIGLLLMVDVGLYLALTPIYMFTVSWKLTLACFALVPIVPIAVARVARLIEKRFEKVQEQFSDLSGQASESFNGVKVIKSFAAEDADAARYAKLSREYRRRALKLGWAQRLEEPLLLLFVGLMQAVVLGYGGYLVLSGELTVAAFVAYFFLILRLAWPMMELGFVIALYQRCVVSRRRIEELMAVPEEIADPPQPVTLAAPKGRIEFRNLTFNYFPGSPDALTGISFTAEPGQTVAFVGEVGCGKSTLLNLIPRLYDPPAGTVFIDGVDVRDLKLEELRRMVACVPQETFLFSETILENIGYGVSGAGRGVVADPATEARLKGYARLARVEGDILAFPGGYSTMLGEKGVNLSGGQKQRVAIARALACEPVILMLDDCLSAVDAETEEAILGGLSGELSRRTSLIVSHRVSAVKNADQIIVLSRGRVIERGTHAQLVAAEGWYADLCRKQALEAEIEKQ
jgi:ATP-binding cassette subfamily B multidrug efflux pump